MPNVIMWWGKSNGPIIIILKYLRDDRSGNNHSNRPHNIQVRLIDAINFYQKYAK